MKILIITDNNWVKDSIEKYINFESQVSVVLDISEIKESFDYVFVDMQIKNNGGPSVIRDLKRNTFTNNAKIVLLADRQADEFQAKRVGADFFIVKPITSSLINSVFKD